MATLTDILTWEDIRQAANRICDSWEPRPVYGVPRGGAAPAALVAGTWGTPLLDAPEPGCLVVDDLIDSGATWQRFLEYDFDALFRKAHSPTLTNQAEPMTRDGWLVFPWEGDETSPEDAVRRLLQYVGEDPERDGLADTPRRVTKAWREMTTGYNQDPASILSVQFAQDADHYGGIIALRRVPFSSLCEHHVLPFTGYADVAYIPGESGRIVGLSKLARLVDIYARRLQVQERLTVQIVEALQAHLEPAAAACVIRADHTCMSLRGVTKTAGGMVTSEMRGLFMDDPRARAELMALLEGQV